MACWHQQKACKVLGDHVIVFTCNSYLHGLDQVVGRDAKRCSEVVGGAQREYSNAAVPGGILLAELVDHLHNVEGPLTAGPHVQSGHMRACSSPRLQSHWNADVIWHGEAQATGQAALQTEALPHRLVQPQLAGGSLD